MLYGQSNFSKIERGIDLKANIYEAQKSTIMDININDSGAELRLYERRLSK